MHFGGCATVRQFRELWSAKGTARNTRTTKDATADIAIAF
jgi:hypothetical protein